MSEVEVVDPRDNRAVAEFVRGIERDSAPTPTRLQLDTDVSLGEVVRAISAAGLVISTIRGGVHLVHRLPKEVA